MIDAYDPLANAISLEEAGLEEDARQPVFGIDSAHGEVWDYCDWWADGQNDQVTL